MSHRLTAAAWIAIVGTVAGAVAFGLFVAQIPFSTMDTGSVFGAAFGVALTAGMFFVPQLLIVFLFDIRNRNARIVGAVLGGLAAVSGLAIVGIWLTGVSFEGSQSYDVKALGLWAPLIVMGIVDGVAALVTLFSLPPAETSTTIRPTTS